MTNNYLGGATGRLSFAAQTELEGRQAIDAGEAFDVRSFGADPANTPAVNTPAIQAAIDQAYAGSGGVVTFTEGIYEIDSKLEIGGGVTLDLRGGQIKQTADNVPIVVVEKAPGTVVTKWGVVNGSLTWTNFQPNTNVNAVGIQFGVAGLTTSNGYVNRVLITKGYRGMSMNDDVGAFTFLNDFRNITIKDCSDFGFWLTGNAAGGHTNTTLHNVWLHDATIVGMSGFNIFGVNGLTLSHCGADALTGTGGAVFNIRSCNGSATVLWAEKWIKSIASGGAYVLLIDDSKFEVDYLYTFQNRIDLLAGSGQGASVRAISGSQAKVTNVQEVDLNYTKAGSDNYYEALTDGGAGGTRLASTIYEYTIGAEPGAIAPNNSLGMFSNAARAQGGFWSWDGVTYKEDRYNNVHTDIPRTQAELLDIGSWANTDLKYAGLQVWDATAGAPVYATGSAAGDVWNNSDGTIALTPI